MSNLLLKSNFSNLMHLKMLARLQQMSFVPDSILTLNLSAELQNEIKNLHPHARIVHAKFSDLKESHFAVSDNTIDLLIADLTETKLINLDVLFLDAKRVLNTTGFFIFVAFNYANDSYFEPYAKQKQETVIHDKKIIANIDPETLFYFSFVREHIFTINLGTEFIDCDMFVASQQKNPLVFERALKIENIEIEKNDELQKKEMDLADANEDKKEAGEFEEEIEIDDESIEDSKEESIEFNESIEEKESNHETNEFEENKEKTEDEYYDVAEDKNEEDRIEISEIAEDKDADEVNEFEKKEMENTEADKENNEVEDNKEDEEIEANEFSEEKDIDEVNEPEKEEEELENKNEESEELENEEENLDTDDSQIENEEKEGEENKNKYSEKLELIEKNNLEIRENSKDSEKNSLLADLMNSHKDTLNNHAAELKKQLHNTASILEQLRKSGLRDNNKVDLLNKKSEEHKEMLSTYNFLLDEHKKLLNNFINTHEKMLEQKLVGDDKYHELIEHHKQLLNEHENIIKNIAS